MFKSSIFKSSIMQDTDVEGKILRAAIGELESIMLKLDHIESKGYLTIGGVRVEGRRVLAEQAYAKAQFEAIILMLYPLYKHLEVHPAEIKKYFRDDEVYHRFTTHYDVRNILY